MKNIYLFLVLSIGFGLNAQVINFPDVNFKARLLAASPSFGVALDLNNNYVAIDTNNNGEIEVSEALNIRYLGLNSANINSLIGITNFSNLTGLECESNNLTQIDLNGLANITILNFSYNQFTTFNFNYLTNLRWLACNGNPLTSLNIDSFQSLYMLQCVNCGLSSIDLNGVPNLTDLYCGYNNLTTLDLSPVPNLKWLGIEFNQFSTINLDNVPLLTSLVADNNQFVNIDCNNLTNLVMVLCRNNPFLNSLFIKNGINEFEVLINNCPNLQYICCDESEIDLMQTQINLNNYINCSAGTYCTFGPGGENYFMNGVSKLDINSNGCDLFDIPLSNLKLNISNGTNSGIYMSNYTGNYSIPLTAGNSVVTPIIENPSYFTISPSNYSNTFPGPVSPVTQNFCITPNGEHNDLEVSILALNNSTPGFNSNYKIIYKNKGTTTLSGTIVLTYDDSILDFVTANPNVNSFVTNSLTWDYSDLIPFEIREIYVTLNVNSPVEIPAVNNGDLIDYNVVIYPVVGDETPNDNRSNLVQTVVNSFDPNDKTCQEGATITPEKVGDYVHYLIRFENNGTANAQNIVVKDMIDTTKFDVSTLIPIDGSHSFVTRITNTNQVEFIFENIQLPFDDATNDGYIAFKIKTKPTLVLGNTFSNTASIYFDYNFPIVTNTYTTTIAALANPDFEFATYFVLSPNPAKNILNIQAKSTVELSSIRIYNTLGQLVLVIPNAKETSSIDVSSLTTGTYFIKVLSDKGSSNAKFIKE